MSRIAEYIHKFHTSSKKAFMRQVYYKLKVNAVYNLYFVHDRIFDTRKKYKEAQSMCVPIKIDTSRLDINQIDKAMAQQLWKMYQSHRFDLLGSGWVKNGFLNNATGLDGYRYDSIELQSDSNGEFLLNLLCSRNYKSSQKIWQLISLSYIPIDWQKDFKSGYRWGADQWYRPQGNAKKPGGDIKVPWELARLQHFPRMAIIALKLSECRKDIFEEFCNQLLDFIAQNPPRMGVNYMCTMDVGIRTANVALAYSLFYDMGMLFSEELEKVISNFMFQQCEHIMKNLEWSDILTSNHYFANVAGLLFGSAVLPECQKKERWQQFAVKQVKQEIDKQFYREGTNKEGSTAYHRLTGDMAVYSLALIHYLSKQGKCSDAEDVLYDMINKAGIFTVDITNPEGLFSQIGDNDSGVFFRLSITGEILTTKKAKQKYKNLQNYMPEDEEEPYLDECMNDGFPFCSAVYGLCQNPMLQQAKEVYPLEYSLVSQMMDNNLGQKIPENALSVEQINGTFSTLEYCSAKEFISQEGSLLNNMKRICYPSFGLYIFRSQSLYLCINACDNGQKGNAGHAHNDKLSFELFINGKCIFCDCGTYVYTPLPEERNQFRSIHTHNTIYAGEEQNEFINLFSMKSRTECRCIRWCETEAVFEVRYGDIHHIRAFKISDEKVSVNDYCNVPFEENWKQGAITYGYGKKENSIC